MVQKGFIFTQFSILFWKIQKDFCFIVSLTNSELTFSDSFLF